MYPFPLPRRMWSPSSMGDEERVARAKREVQDLLPASFFVGRTVIAIDVHKKCIEEYCESEIATFCAALGIVRWKERTNTQRKRLLTDLLNTRWPSAFVDKKWSEPTASRRIHLVFNGISIMTFADGAIEGVVSGYPYLCYKNATVVGTMSFHEVWDMDDVKMTKEAFRNFGPSIDKLLEPFLIKPIRNIVRDFSPFF